MDLIRDLQEGPSTFRAFAKSKSATKGALIADLRALNSALVKPVPFKLPSLSQLGHLFSVCKTVKLKLFFTKLHISNMYWACKVPAEFRNSIRFRVNGVSYYVPSLPFGWAFSPIIAIETLARYLSLQHPGQVTLIQYLDDVLLASVSQRCCGVTLRLARDLVQGGWVVSPKSALEPDTCVTWLGKKIDGSEFSMQQTHTYLAQTLKGWLKLACCSYTEKRLRMKRGCAGSSER